MLYSQYKVYKKNFQYTEPGSQYRTEFIKKFDDNGVEYLEENGKTDLQAMYDAMLESTDLSLIVKTIIDSGVNPFSNKLDVLEETVNYEDVSNFTASDILLAKQNYHYNKAKIEEYEAKIKELEKQTQVVETQTVKSGESEVK